MDRTLCSYSVYAQHIIVHHEVNKPHSLVTARGCNASSLQERNQ